MTGKPGDNPWEAGYQRDLPDVRGERAPLGLRAGLRVEERFNGCLLVIFGLVGFAGVYAVVLFGGFSGGPQPPPGPGGLPVRPLITASNCLMPLIVLGSLGLIIVGTRRIFDP